jgi:diguanylate cyclase (GGDEF)-like protein
MTIFVFAATANYLAAAGWIAVMGHDVSWSYVVVVAALLQFMGLSAGVLADGEERLRAVIAEVAVTDSLTGLPNRRRFHDAYATNLEDAVAQQLPLALMLIDVDHFKEINDEFGHPAGDDKLREVAQGLRGVLRATDLVARYGGDEFVVVAPHATRESARALAERMRNAARECDASVSIGVAIYPEDAPDQDALISAADAALYRAKQAGRNCVWDAAAA